jgi:hypothetical protein
VLAPGGTLLITHDNRANPVVAVRNALPYRLLHRLGVVPYPLGVALAPRRLTALLEQSGFEPGPGTAVMHAPRVLGVGAAAAVERYFGEAAARRLLRLLGACERLERLPTRTLTGYFVAVRAVRL